MKAEQPFNIIKFVKPLPLNSKINRINLIGLYLINFIKQNRGSRVINDFVKPPFNFHNFISNEKNI